MRTEETASNPGQSLVGLLARLVWLLAGPMALAITAAHIAVNAGGAYGASDAVFFAILVTTVLVRVVDVTKLGGATAEGTPAHVGQVVRWAAGLVVVSLGVWALAHWLGGALV